jgi:hypothetical protein
MAEVDLGYYAESAVRNGQRDANLDTVQASFEALDLDLAQVSITGEGCEVCQRWEGQVISLYGNTPEYPTLDEAETDGLFHPNCQHTLEAVDAENLPEVLESDVYDAQVQYEYQQELTRLDGMVRGWELRQDAAVTPSADNYANLMRQEWQTRVDWVESHPSNWQAGAATNQAQAARSLSTLPGGLGLVSVENDDFGAAGYFTVRDLNTIARTLIDTEADFTFEERVAALHFQTETSPLTYGIDSANACAGRALNGNLEVVIGEHVTDLFNPSILRKEYEAAVEGGASAEHLANVRATLHALDTRSFDYIGLHTAFANPNPMEGVLTHELGHIVEQANHDVFDTVLADSFGGDAARAAAECAISERAGDTWHEAIAENFAWYRAGHGDEINHVLREVFDRLAPLKGG